MKEKFNRFCGKLISAFKGWSKKKKIVVASVVIVSVLCVSGGITAAVLLLNREESGGTKIYFDETVYYCYAVGVESNALPVYTNIDWRKGLESAKFNITKGDSSSSGISIAEDGRIVLNAGVSAGDYATISYNYNKFKVAEIRIEAVAVTEYISTLSDLRAIPNNSSGNYILRADLADAGNLFIENFSGSFYGNHHKISRLDVSFSGGLFKKINSGGVYGLELTDVSGNIVSTGGGIYGTLCAEAYSSDFRNIKTSGVLTVSFAPLPEEAGFKELSVGGIFGELTDDERKADLDPNVNFVYNAVSKVDLNLTVSGTVYAGGITGKSQNVTLSYCDSAGKIEISSAYSPIISVGGIAGECAKRYLRYGNNIRSYDLGTMLSSSTDITIKSTNAADFCNLYAGGIYGRLINHNIGNAKYSGNLNAVLERLVDAYVAKVAGFAANSKNIGNAVPMYISSSETDDAQVSVSLNYGSVYSGDIANISGDIVIR